MGLQLAIASTECITPAPAQPRKPVRSVSPGQLSAESEQRFGKGAALGHVEELRNAAEIIAISKESSPSKPDSTPPSQRDVNLKLTSLEV